MKKSVYLDATIPSFYHEDRTGTIIRAWREITIQFWEHAAVHYDLYASDETIRELEDLGYPAEKRAKCLSLLAGIPKLAINDDIVTLAQHYVRNRVMPSNDMGDAFHLAFATFYRLEYLVTWNCKHLANANKFAMIEALHQRLRMVSPRIVTPEQLLEIVP